MPKQGRVIVSCTSTHDRLELLFYAVKSISRQTFKPDRFYINISREPYLRDKGIKKLPSWLEDEDATVNFVENIGSYRKLLPILSEAEESDLIITIDDDVLYHPDWLKRMVETAREHPSEIVCGRAKSIKKNFFGKYQSYYNWRRIKKSRSGFWLLPIGCAGIAYRKNLIDESFINDRRFLDIAQVNDDLWFRVASLKLNVGVHVNRKIEEGNINLVHNKGLENSNVFSVRGSPFVKKLVYELYGRIFGYLGGGLSGNDNAWKDIIKYLNLKKMTL
ncbi:Glycosyl transferase family 2 [Modicisalibacter ilicicola DSM 19980]|uniref:Glycosyl transferase family 2 n=1 Tax=Modicisalibacter ilicicola DSM 19980 TaxID=1121942 RepID=A0A1M5BZN3_9GAMM|nr:glycosyltransferase [Halomonas ilicicola]SHF47948.1 Glycosyl transferase family 2 [Halomonas ilicicola DSM 19980]